MSPTAARKVAATIRLTPGTVISRRSSRPLQACGGDQRARPRDLAVQEGDQAQPGVDGLLLFEPAARGSLSQARPFGRTGRWPAGGPSGGASGRRGSRSCRERALTSCARRASRRRITRVRSSGIQIASSAPAASSFASARASRRSVFARACAIPVSLRVDHHHARRRAPRGSARSPTRCPSPPARHGHRRQALRRTPQRFRRRARAPGRRRGTPPDRGSRPHRNRGARPTRPIAPSTSSPGIDLTGEPAGKRHRRIRARSATGPVAGAAERKTGLKAHPQNTACPLCVLPEKPLVPSRSTQPTRGAGQQTSHAAVSCLD